MNKKDLMKKKITESEKRIQELFEANELKKMSPIEKNEVSDFYHQKCCRASGTTFPASCRRIYNHYP